MARTLLRRAVLGCAFYIAGLTVVVAQIPTTTTQVPEPAPVVTGEPAPRLPLAAETPVEPAVTNAARSLVVDGRPKAFSKALASETQTLDQVTLAYLKTMVDDDYLNILPSADRKPVLPGPFGAKPRSLMLPANAKTPTAAIERMYASDSSLATLIDWYAQNFGFDFVVRRMPLSGAHAGDTLTIARAFRRVENTIVSIMIWNPSSALSGRKADRRALLQRTSVEIQERAFRPREELVVEGPDAVVQLTWDTPYRDLIQTISERYQIDPFLLAALVQQESGFNAEALSVDSAMGLTQMIPATADAMGVENPNDPHQSLDGGARYLKMMLARFNGDVILALAAYNAGPGNVVKYGGVPPFTETRDYVRRIMARYREKAGGSHANAAAVKVAG